MIPILLWLGGLGFAVFGGLLLIDPIGGYALLGIGFADQPAVRLELRAFMGGIELALAFLILGCAVNGERWRSGLWVMASAYLGLGLGRATGMVFEGGTVSSMFASALALELVLGGLAAWMLWRDR